MKYLLLTPFILYALLYLARLFFWIKDKREEHFWNSVIKNYPNHNKN